MTFFADFHIHSRYSHAAHADMDIPTIARWAKLKGLGLVGTGDFLHPAWLSDLKKLLKPAAGHGIFEHDNVKFMLTAEVSCDSTQGGRHVKIHHLILAPHFAAVEKLTAALAKHGDLQKEGLPSVALSPQDLVMTVLDASPESLLIPAHAFGLDQAVFSPQFGYNLLSEAYGEAQKHVRVIETGLSADPALARRWSRLDDVALISNSDARHPAQLGREATIFDCALDYKDITAALLNRDKAKFLGTVEAYSEEDMYFASGHKACQWRKNQRAPTDCWVCGKPPHGGVVDRIESAADRSPEEAQSRAETFHRVVPLLKIVSDVLGFRPETESVQKQYMAIVTRHGPELDILLNWDAARLARELPHRVAEHILASRRGSVKIEPGYDGVPGQVQVIAGVTGDDHPDQLKLFK